MRNGKAAPGTPGIHCTTFTKSCAGSDVRNARASRRPFSRATGKRIAESDAGAFGRRTFQAIGHASSSTGGQGAHADARGSAIKAARSTSRRRAE